MLHSEVAVRVANAVERALQAFVNQTLRIIIVGASGVGKSTLLNELFGLILAREDTGLPVSMEFKEHSIPNNNDNKFILVDTHGFECETPRGPKSNKEMISDYIRDRANDDDFSNHIHMAILCLNGSTRRYFKTDLDIAKVFAELGLPTIIAVTRAVSGSTAVRHMFIEQIENEFIAVERQALITIVNGLFPSNQGLKKQTIVDCIQNYTHPKIEQDTSDVRSSNKIFYWPELRAKIKALISEQSQYNAIIETMDRHCLKAKVVPLLARREEYGDHVIESFGLDNFNDAVVSFLDEVNRNAIYGAAQVLISTKVKIAEACLLPFITAAGIIGVSPIPFTDAILLAPLEVAMMQRIATVFDQTIGKNSLTAVVKDVIAGVTSGRVTGLTGSYGARYKFVNAMKLIPGAGTLVGGVVGSITAVAFTQAFGQIFIGAMARIVQRDSPMSVDNILQAMQEHEQTLVAEDDTNNYQLLTVRKWSELR